MTPRSRPEHSRSGGWRCNTLPGRHRVRRAVNHTRHRQSPLVHPSCGHAAVAPATTGPADALWLSRLPRPTKRLPATDPGLPSAGTPGGSCTYRLWFVLSLHERPKRRSRKVPWRRPLGDSRATRYHRIGRASSHRNRRSPIGSDGRGGAPSGAVGLAIAAPPFGAGPASRNPRRRPTVTDTPDSGR